MAWTLAQAKEHLEEIIERAANDGPQIVEVSGGPAVTIAIVDASKPVAPSAADRPRRGMKDLLEMLPDLSDVPLERNPLPARDIGL